MRVYNLSFGRDQTGPGLSAMLVSRLRLWRFLLPPLSHLSHHFLVFIGRQHAHQSHHAHHRARPARRKPIRLRLGDGLIHDHVHILPIPGHSSPVRLVHAHHAVLMTALRCLWREARPWPVCGCPLCCGCCCPTRLESCRSRSTVGPRPRQKPGARSSDKALLPRIMPMPSSIPLPVCAPDLSVAERPTIETI